MREFKIAVANSRKSAKWKNTTVTWPGLCERLQHTVYTAETSAEYWAMSKDERDAAKDKGGFVGGCLRNGRRKIVDVECRSLITHDVDTPDPDFLERFKREFRYAAILYTTHSHMPEKPRYRVVIALEEDIPPERYAAVSRFLAAEFGIEQYDPVSFVTNQLMHWPSTSKDAEFICEIIEGPFLNAGTYLAEHPGWEDYTKLPMSSREQKQKSPGGEKQEDPLKKDGIVGAFCRTYSIHDAIEKFLSDVYAPSVVEDRYDYIPGEGSCGVVVYDDKYVYSHHATDPAGGKLSNAFDLVRRHKFADDDEKTSFLRMSAFAEADELVKETLEKECVAQAQEDFKAINSSWEEPIPFGRHTIVPFPLDTLPPAIADYVCAYSESIQVPVDMVGVSALTTISTSMQGKYVIEGKPDWIEPTNIYAVVVANPSERKSAAQHGPVKPLGDYENRYNQMNAAAVETSRMHKRALERRQTVIVDQFAKGNASQADVDNIAREITEYEVLKPLRLFVDDITPEKLTSVLAENHGRMALLSSEAGIFDTLAGAYSKSVNIDVMLKSYSGDSIRVDRIGRDSETIMHPALTVLLMAQPSVISKVLGNGTFRGRGLTARFLYSMPVSTVGARRYRSRPVRPEVYAAYESCIFDILDDEYSESPEVIHLSPEADALLEAFSQELEPKLVKEYAEIADWCGKLAGNTLRIAGLLCRAGTHRSRDFLDVPAPLVVDGQTMANAIRLGKYFLNHAQAVFNVLPENAMFLNAHKVLKMIHEKGLKEFNRRTAMRFCQTFKRVEEIQPVLDFLEDYGYIAATAAQTTFGKGRPPMPKYLVNPWVERYYCHFDVASVIPRKDTNGT